MSQAILPIQPQDATKILLKNLSSRRMRDVIERRFGLRGGGRHTLEAIGTEYKITRERVRQIEADALKHLRKDEAVVEVASIFSALHNHMKNYGEVMAEHHLFDTLAESRYHPHLGLLLEIGKPFHKVPETDQCFNRWTVNKDATALVEKIVVGVIQNLEEKKHPVSHDELKAIITKNAKDILGVAPNAEAVEAYKHTSRKIKQNPYGEYGLVSWSEVNPRGVKDKAYVVLAKCGKPMHFREVASAINNVGWSKKKAHPQTVHNELIKDKRFVLVGRGLYGLTEWGYEPGVVRDVLVSVLKKSNKPLSKDQIIKLVLEKRFVKPQTVVLNLQNKALFKRTEGDCYALV